MKRTMFMVLFLQFCSSVLMGADVAADFKAAVEAAMKDFPAAIAAKDAPRLGAFYAKDAIAFPPNSEMIKGRDAIQAFWKGFMDAGMAVQLETVEMEGDGNLGVEVGQFKILGSDGKQVDHGKYVVVWKKEDGAWKLYRDIWNTNMAAPAPASK